MRQTLIEKIISNHSKHDQVKPGDIIDVDMDVRAARDFGGANVVKNLKDNQLSIDDPAKTFFTFDCNPTGSDQKYAINQHKCRIFARENDIKIYDINEGIGTHILINKGLVFSGATAVTTDSHANILGAVGAFGQGMGDQDIAAAWAKGKVWFKVPESVKIVLSGERPAGISAKDIVLNMLDHFGANTLLGYSVELYGEEVDQLSLDERITISSMGTEMGAIILFITPSDEILNFSSKAAGRQIDLVAADEDAQYAKEFELDLQTFTARVSNPGAPHNTSDIETVRGQWIDSAFIGSCTNGRFEDLYAAAKILEGRKIAPHVVLKIVPSTDEIWMMCQEKGIIDIFKKAGALVSNAGCAGCAAGQVGQNGPGEVSISTGNRNFPGKQGKGDVFLASPEAVAASALAGFVTTPDQIPGLEEIEHFSQNAIRELKFDKKLLPSEDEALDTNEITDKPLKVKGRVWFIDPFPVSRVQEPRRRSTWVRKSVLIIIDLPILQNTRLLRRLSILARFDVMSFDEPSRI